MAWLEIYVEDINRAKNFYESVLNRTLMQLPMDDETEMWVFPMVENAPNASGALVKHPMDKPSSTGTLVYFACEDCAKEIGLVESASGKVIQEKTSLGEFGFMGLAQDTEGNTIDFHSQS